MQACQKNFHGQAVKAYEEIINHACQDGWKLLQIDTVSSSQKPGCLGSIFGAKDQVVSYKLLVFEREV